MEKIEPRILMDRPVCKVEKTVWPTSVYSVPSQGSQTSFTLKTLLLFIMGFQTLAMMFVSASYVYF